MLNFLKDSLAELRGFDMVALKKEELEKLKKEKAEKIFLSKSLKLALRLIGGFCCFWLGFSIYLWAQNDFTPMIFKYVFLLLIAFAAVILTFCKGKRTELALIICTVIFVFISMAFI